MSNSAPPANTCPQCGAAIATGAPEGLCPRCVVALNLCADTAFTAEAEAQPAPAPEEIAAHFPHLEVLEVLGRGGMGVVYKARQKALGRLVALKLLAPERVADPKFAERFAHEAKALAALNHPSIVTIHDFGQAGGFFYLLMEFVDGVNLRQAMRAGRFTPEQALAIVPPVCEALQYAHEHGIVHRDIKPENLLLDREGRVKIADFGVAKIMGADTPAAGLAHSQPAGTPQYMAPEQKAHRATDHRADIYSLGVVLYEMLTGELPSQKMQPPSRKVQMDVRIDEIVMRALEKQPELRWQTAVEFRTQLETMESPAASPVAGTGKTPWWKGKAAIFTLLAAVLLAAFASFQRRHHRLTPSQSAKNANSPLALTFLSIEHPAGSHRLLIHFQREGNSSLGIEAYQDYEKGSNGSTPGSEDPFWVNQNRRWYDQFDPPLLEWALPDSFTPSEVEAGAKRLEKELHAKNGALTRYPEGAASLLGSIQHRDGWKYRLAIRVKRSSDMPVQRAVEAPSRAALAQPRPWSPEQACGEPNTSKNGDYSTAWAPKEPDAGVEWLEVTFPAVVEAARLRVYASCGDGALRRLVAFVQVEESTETKSPGGAIAADAITTRSYKAVEVCDIIDSPVSSIGADVAVKEIEIPAGIRSDRFRLYLDTKSVAGWNEIDAVQLIGRDASKQWANRAAASSTYATYLQKHSEDLPAPPQEAGSKQRMKSTDTLEAEQRQAALASLSEFPSLKTLSLETTEAEFVVILTEQKLPFEREQTAEATNYYAHVEGKEKATVYVSFRQGKCSGIQALRP